MALAGNPVLYQCARDPAVLQRLNISLPVGNQHRWGSAVCHRTGAINMVKVQSPGQKQHCISPAPYLGNKHLCFRPGKNQRYPCAVVCQLSQPQSGLLPIRWVTPNPAIPRPHQAEVVHRVMVCRHRPRSFYRGARVEVKSPKRSQYFRRRQPLIFQHSCALVCSNSHKNPLTSQSARTAEAARYFNRYGANSKPITVTPFVNLMYAWLFSPCPQQALSTPGNSPRQGSAFPSFDPSNTFPHFLQGRTSPPKPAGSIVSS